MARAVSVLIPLGLTAAVSAADEGIQKKVLGVSESCDPRASGLGTRALINFKIQVFWLKVLLNNWK